MVAETAQSQRSRRMKQFRCRSEHCCETTTSLGMTAVICRHSHYGRRNNTHQNLIGHLLQMLKRHRCVLEFEFPLVLTRSFRKQWMRHSISAIWHHKLVMASTDIVNIFPRIDDSLIRSLTDWAYLENWCRKLTNSFEDVYVFTVPLYLPQQGQDGKWRVVSDAFPIFRTSRLTISLRHTKSSDHLLMSPYQHTLLK